MLAGAVSLANTLTLYAPDVLHLPSNCPNERLMAHLLCGFAGFRKRPMQPAKEALSSPGQFVEAFVELDRQLAALPPVHPLFDYRRAWRD